MTSAAPPILSITIPTYNRANFLRKILGDIREQLSETARVEIVICDNASTDETPAVVAEFQAAGLPLRFLQSEVNGGPDKNILRCFHMTRGKYCWVIGDDDRLYPGTIGTVMNYLAREDDQYDLLYLSYKTFTENFDPGESVSGSTACVEIRNVDAYVKRMDHALTFITGNIFNRERVIAKGTEHFESLLGTNLVQLNWMYALLNGFQRGLYFPNPMVGARDSNSEHCFPIQTFGENFRRITEERVQRRSTRRILINSVVRTLLPFYILRARRAGEFENFRQPVIRAFRDQPLFWIFDYPAATLPLWSLDALWFGLRGLNKAARIGRAMRLSVAGE